MTDLQLGITITDRIARVLLRHESPPEPMTYEGWASWAAAAVVAELGLTKETQQIEVTPGTRVDGWYTESRWVSGWVRVEEQG